MPLIIWSLTNNAFFHTASGTINVSGSSPLVLDTNAEFNVGLIGIVLSGGSSNTNPKLSLGGNPSSYPITGSNNNLFSDILEAEKRAVAITDYRCFYVFNDNATGTFYNSSIYISSQVDAGSNVQIGIDFRKDIQKIVIGGSPAGGSFTLEYLSPGEDGHSTITADYNANADIWAANLQKAFNDTASLDGLIVTTEIDGAGKRVFTITFDGINSNKFHENLKLSANNLTPGGTTITISKIQDGSPIDSIAPSIDTERVSPSRVVFYDTSSLNRLFIGSLHPDDGFPVWIKRTTTTSSQSTESDGFSIGYSGIEMKSQIASKGRVWHLKAGGNALEIESVFQDLDGTTQATADNTRVRRWVDLTPFRHNFIAAGPTSASQARPVFRTKASSTSSITGKPAIWSSLDGPNGGPAYMYMQENTVTGDKSEVRFDGAFHLFLVVRRLTIDASLALIGHLTSASAPYIAQVGSGGVGKLHFRAIAGGAVDNSLTWPSSTNQSQILEIKRSANGFVDAAFNGGSFNRLFSNLAQTGTFSFNRLFGHVGFAAWGGYASELIAFNLSLESNDRSNLLTDLSAEYSITIS
jgi:hypothetical protein